MLSSFSQYIHLWRITRVKVGNILEELSLVLYNIILTFAFNKKVVRFLVLLNTDKTTLLSIIYEKLFYRKYYKTFAFISIANIIARICDATLRTKPIPCLVRIKSCKLEELFWSEWQKTPGSCSIGNEPQVCVILSFAWKTCCTMTIAFFILRIFVWNLCTSAAPVQTLFKEAAWTVVVSMCHIVHPYSLEGKKIHH